VNRFTVKEIAKIMGVKPRTVRTFLEKARAHLGYPDDRAVAAEFQEIAVIRIAESARRGKQP
jgi:DNA-directed RNA polymerase specialized sigma24 family protein